MSGEKKRGAAADLPLDIAELGVRRAVMVEGNMYAERDRGTGFLMIGTPKW